MPAGQSVPSLGTSPLNRMTNPSPRRFGERFLPGVSVSVAVQTTTTSVATDKILSVNNIEVIYDHVILVLKGVSLEVPKGGIVALLGANGAGKTTTLKAISNLLHAERGDVSKGSIEFGRRRSP